MHECEWQFSVKTEEKIGSLTDHRWSHLSCPFWLTDVADRNDSLM